MTCKEKFRQDHPELNDLDVGLAIGSSCPSDHGYPELVSNCGDCNACWNMDIPVTETITIDTLEPTIKDSGDRTQFETGAVRDMRVGKGRFDIAPLEVISKMIDPDGDTILDDIASFMKNNNTVYLYDALNTFTGAYHNQIETLLLEVAVHFEEGAKKYGDANYKKGIPANCYIDSAVRHYLKWLRGDKDEFHNRAFVWNLMCCIWEVDYREKKEEI